METGKLTRRPSCAGFFYPANERDLRKLIDNCFTAPQGPGSPSSKRPSLRRQTIGLISPHAGFVYSGPVAAHGFFKLSAEAKPQRVIILGPNHRSLGAPIALSAAGAWETPMGTIKIDRDGTDRLLSKNDWLKTDENAHVAEHSLEVQLPFLQYIYGDSFTLIPITMEWLDVDICRGLGNAIAAAFSPEDTLIVASSDLSHYERQDTVNNKDSIALEAIVKLDVNAFADAVQQYNITACGIGPIIAALTACSIWGATEAQVLRHATSGDVSGDYDRVVGYASVAVI